MPSFHFVLNDATLVDNRIPPYKMSRDEAVERNAQPIPATQFGNPGVGGFYDHWDDVALNPPRGAVRADIRLMYQPTSWEYVQFLVLANNGSITAHAGRGSEFAGEGRRPRVGRCGTRSQPWRRCRSGVRHAGAGCRPGRLLGRVPRR